MTRPLALGAALLGGICWVLNLYVDATALWWPGTVLLLGAAALLGLGLARLPWVVVVAAVAGLGSAALAWSLAVLLRDLGEAQVVEAVIGAGAALLVGIAMLLPARGRVRGGARVRTTSRSVGRAGGPGNHRG